MNDISVFRKYLTTRPGYDFSEPYGFYMVPLAEDMALSCYLASGESEDEEGWEHLSIMVRFQPRAYKFHGERSKHWTWKKRYPSQLEVRVARLLFFRKEEWVVQFYPPENLLDPTPVGGELITHLWARKAGLGGLVIPPPMLLESFRNPKG